MFALDAPHLVEPQIRLGYIAPDAHYHDESKHAAPPAGHSKSYSST